jgi:hypothetical protein
MYDLQILEETADGASILVCPGCGDHNLHQCVVEVFNRYQEDNPSGLHVVINDQALSRDVEMDGNPSARRDGMYIYFACEHCPGIVRLSIAQHKGNTLVECSYSEPADD